MWMLKLPTALQSETIVSSLSLPCPAGAYVSPVVALSDKKSLCDGLSEAGNYYSIGKTPESLICWDKVGVLGGNPLA